MKKFSLLDALYKKYVKSMDFSRIKIIYNIREINAESMNFDKRQNKTRIEKASVYSKSCGRRKNGRKNIPKSLHGEN